MAKISDFMISIVIVCAVITMIMLVLTDGTQQYAVTYDNSSFSGLANKQAQLYNLTQNLSNQTSSITSQNSVFDILGSLASQGYLAVKSTFVSIDLFTSMTSESFGEINLGPLGSILQSTIITIVLIIIIVGIVIALIVKWPT